MVNPELLFHTIYQSNFHGCVMLCNAKCSCSLQYALFFHVKLGTNIYGIGAICPTVTKGTLRDPMLVAGNCTHVSLAAVIAVQVIGKGNTSIFSL